MNILYLCARVPFPPKDGGTIGVWSLAHNLSKIKNKITILALNTKKHYVNICKIQDDLPKDVNILAVDINTDIKILPAIKNLFFSKLPYIISRFHSKNYEKQLEKLIIENKFDIIQIESPTMFFYIPTIRKYTNAPIIARTANVESEIWTRVSKQEKNILRKKYYELLAVRMEYAEIESISTSDAFIAVTDINTQYFANKILEKSKNKSKKIPSRTISTGVNSEDILSTSIEHEYISFCFIGALDWRPNQEGLFWFLENVWNKFLEVTREKNNKYKFHIAGRQASAHLISILNNYKHVVFHGEIPDAKEYIKQHSVMLVPLLSGSGMRVKIIEGMANGAAIISTTIGAEGIKVEHSKNILLADTPEDFLNSMILLSENIKLTNKLSSAGLEFVKREYDNLSIASKLNDFYLELLNI